jgi:hypothetical protein
MQTQTSHSDLMRETPAKITDAGKVRIGGYFPSLPPVRPIPANVADGDRVRLGGYFPTL